MKNAIKSAARSLGLYRPLRWLYRHTLGRDELRALGADKALFRQFVKEGALCFDVGANYGEKSRALLELGCRVVAFEPQPDCLEELRARLGNHPHLTVNGCAVGATFGRASMRVNRHRGASSLSPDWPGETVAHIEVDVTTLDLAIALYGLPDFVKIDVEGFELQVLRGLSQPVAALCFEYDLRPGGDARALECVTKLASLGEYRFNLVGGESATLAGDWLPAGPFAEAFGALARAAGGGYGDVYARLVR